MTKVRTTMHPDKEYDVGPQELLDLQRQGLLLKDPGDQVDVSGTSTALPVEEK